MDTRGLRRGKAGDRFGDRQAAMIADAMFALSTPSRVQILKVLLEGPSSVRQLTEALGMEQSAVSHQLRVLREHSLVRAERSGRHRVYALYDDHVVDLLRAAAGHVGEPRPSKARKGTASGR